jgi:CxxC motif-containing protein (DUF1111 family)
MIRPTLAFAAGTAALFVAAAFAGNDAPIRTDLTEEDLARVEAVTAPAADFTEAEPFEAMQGGAATSRKKINRDAFSNFSANISFAEEETFKLGNALFRKLWVSSPSSTQASDGLGPLFNARACQSCHLKDGRGHPPEGIDESSVSMFLRVSVPPSTPEEEAMIDNLEADVIAEPTYGTQIQDLAVPGLHGEGTMEIAYAEEEVTLGDGTVVSLRRPEYSLTDLGYGELHPEAMFSPRVASPMIGLGLLEAIPEADIAAWSDPDDADGDGISGRLRHVRDPETGEVVLGRFGWKSGAPTVRAQTASAFAGDIGISTPLVDKPHGDCTRNQADCLAAQTGEQARLGETEAPDPVLDLVTFYSQNLAVPARRDVEDPTVLAGKELFYGLGCTSCHRPKYVTSREAEIDALKFQLIWPYTDMLLHDMGEGLADHRPEGTANGYEWRTPPLWGIGLTETVSGHTLFLHDGRARSLTEAILWHGGEAQAARDGFAALDATDRKALLTFLGSL